VLNKIININSEKGVSLIELLIAFTILAIVVLGFSSMFLSGFKAIGTARDYSIALNLSREKIEEIKEIKDKNYNDVSSDESKGITVEDILNASGEEIGKTVTVVSERNGKTVTLKTQIYDY